VPQSRWIFNFATVALVLEISKRHVTGTHTEPSWPLWRAVNDPSTRCKNLAWLFSSRDAAAARSWRGRRRKDELPNRPAMNWPRPVSGA